MKTKLILLALVSAAATSVLSANAGIHVGFSIGLPAPIITTAPVVVSAPYVENTAQIPVAPAPMVEAVPACPGVDYVWSAGYWSYRPTGYIWVHGAWNYRAHAAFDDHARFNDHDGLRGYDHNDHHR